MAWCRANGVRVIMLTGDHPSTARAVAIEMGLSATPAIVTGDDLAAASDVTTAIREVDVVARALPAQELAIVRALQHAGELVAVTGDGVNDVPALQAADVGIAMGNKGARIEISAIKVVAPNVALRVVDRAIQAHGGAGVSQDTPLAAMWAGLRTLRFADGPDEVHRMQLARRELRPYLEAGDGGPTSADVGVAR